MAGSIKLVYLLFPVKLIALGTMVLKPEPVRMVLVVVIVMPAELKSYYTILGNSIFQVLIQIKSSSVPIGMFP